MKNFEGPKRILHVVSSLNMGGAEQFVLDLAKEMNKLDKTVTSIFSFGNASETLETLCKSNGLTVLHARSGILRQYIQLRKLLDTYDIVHIHSSHALSRWMMAALSLSRKKAKIFYTRHNNQVHIAFKWRVLYKIAQRYLSGTVFICEANKLLFLQEYPSYHNKCRLIANGVPAIELNYLSAGVCKLRIGSVGRFVPIKAQLVLIDAIKLLPETTQNMVEIHFYGDGPLLQHAQKIADTLSGTSFNFHGLVSDKTQIYSNLDVLVVTSESEGMSLVILEAMSAGITVIASRVGGNVELVVDGITGFLYDFADSKQLALLINEAVADRAALRRYGLAGQDLFKSSFTLQRCAENYLAYYREFK